MCEHLSRGQTPSRRLCRILSRKFDGKIPRRRRTKGKRALTLDKRALHDRRNAADILFTVPCCTSSFLFFFFLRRIYLDLYFHSFFFVSWWHHLRKIEMQQNRKIRLKVDDTMRNGLSSESVLKNFDPLLLWFYRR